MGEQSAENEVGYEESIRRLEREAKPWTRTPKNGFS